MPELGHLSLEDEGIRRVLSEVLELDGLQIKHRLRLQAVNTEDSVTTTGDDIVLKQGTGMSRPLRIAIASGKGGTGKTTIATNLAFVLAGRGERVSYVDCDVEEPNGHIFLRPTMLRREDVTVLVPAVDESRCGACQEACRYSAILALPNQVLTFPALCHGCGGCALACPEDAIREIPRRTGVIEEGTSGELGFLHGKLDVGEAKSPPVIRALLDAVPGDRLLVLDAPPGTSCPVVESIKGADVVLLVTEPTPFGLNDLELAVEMVRALDLPFGVAVNRAGSGSDDVLHYCADEKIPLLAQIPNDREIAGAYSRGVLAVNALPRLSPVFEELFRDLGGIRDGGGGGGAGRDRVLHKRPKVIANENAALPSAMASPGKRSDVVELTVVSGKGGTGKTSIVASFFALAEESAIADCDVDAADLHLVLSPSVQQSRPFSGGSRAAINAERCNGCGLCTEHCRFDAVESNRDGVYEIDPISCEGCGVCADICPEDAVEMTAPVNGEWFVSETRHGPMVHARLGIAEENSGKLVSLIRREAAALSSLKGRALLICDGSPGIGCPVIASITGARMVLVVTEPTLSGLHDLKRVAALCRQLNLKAGVCTNKADINLEISELIEREAAKLDLPVLGRIRYDEAVTKAQVRRMAVVEAGDGPAARDIRALWKRVGDMLDGLS